MKRQVITAIIVILAGYLLICLALYFYQEKLLFFPQKLPAEYSFNFSSAFEEKNYEVEGGIRLNALLFKSANREKVVFYLHGNGGAIDSWGFGADQFLDNGYDVLYLDYRGYGKSGGEILNEEQLISDAQTVYDDLSGQYAESNITLIGTSVGSGVAVQLAAKNNPGRLILNSPYASLKQLIREKYPMIPGMIIKYPLESKKYLKEIKCPIYVFHGKEDTLIPYAHSVELKKVDTNIDLVLIDNFGHNDLASSPELKNKMNTILK